ncbi:hypothetical protein QFZ24_001699 [Streptomyces phaeochromogenes]|jgi:hypothetical protein|nr:hypothetical protein [Streptomyces phaeochromogenes]
MDSCEQSLTTNTAVAEIPARREFRAVPIRHPYPASSSSTGELARPSADSTSTGRPSAYPVDVVVSLRREGTARLLRTLRSHQVLPALLHSWGSGTAYRSLLREPDALSLLDVPEGAATDDLAQRVQVLSALSSVVVLTPGPSTPSSCCGQEPPTCCPAPCRRSNSPADWPPNGAGSARRLRPGSATCAPCRNRSRGPGSCPRGYSSTSCCRPPARGAAMTCVCCWVRPAPR